MSRILELAGILKESHDDDEAKREGKKAGVINIILAGLKNKDIDEAHLRAALDSVYEAGWTDAVLKMSKEAK